jgi:glycosyltransferase involved in cell wall biosynthesis
MKRILIIVPCFNEANNIHQVVTDIRQAINKITISADILVIDDGSTDATFNIAKNLAPSIRLPLNCGVEAALHTGYIYAYRNGFDTCVHVDGDGQHPTYEIQRLIQAALEEKTDIVLTSRYIATTGFQSSFLRRIGRIIISKIAQIVYGISISDPTSGFKLITGEAMKKFSTSYASDYNEPVSLSLITSHGFNFVEIPVDMKPRLHGDSYLKGIQSLAYMIKVTLRMFFTGGRR